MRAGNVILLRPHLTPMLIRKEIHRIAEAVWRGEISSDEADEKLEQMGRALWLVFSDGNYGRGPASGG